MKYTTTISIEDEYINHHEALSEEQCGCDHSESIKEIDSRLNKGDLWAWCSVRVTATCGDLVGTAHLGGCSYKDEDDFKKCGYYEDMVEEATDDLKKVIEFHKKLFAS